MDSRYKTLTLVAVTIPLLSGCFASDKTDDAGKLKEALTESSGVSSVDVDYSAPITLQSGQVTVTVEMDPDAQVDDVIAVVTATYDAFTHAHKREEGNLEIDLGDDLLTLRNFSSDATVEAVTETARQAMTLVEAETAFVHLNTQDVTAKPYVETSFQVAAAQNTPHAVVETLAQMTAEFSEFASSTWRISGSANWAGDAVDWTLGAIGRFPNPAEVARFNRFADAVPSGARVLAIDTSSTVTVPDSTEAADLLALTEFGITGLGSDGYLYFDINTDEVPLASFSPNQCWFYTSPNGEAIKAATAEFCADREVIGPEAE